ncbi:MAG: NAD(P) transhydrogenase subunit alpha [Planctomycetales bacterium]|nr:NAD(P) transhydrogenase subunit alpha [Planctomycetales bacterium]
MVCGLAIWLNNGLASGQSARGPSLSTVASPEESTSPAAAVESVKKSDLLASLTIFALAIFVGFEIITKVPPTLHTPLMSGSNAISGITLVGALIVAGVGMQTSSLLGMFAVILATINVVGGFLVTHRMLAMFKRR